MSNFNVPNMSCGHCTASIERAVMAVDPTATVSFDLVARSVAVESVLNDRALTEAIRRAGHEVTAYA